MEEQVEREATKDEISEYMEALGFEMDYIDEFHNEQYEVFDAVPNNVLYGIEAHLLSERYRQFQRLKPTVSSLGTGSFNR